MCRGEIDSEEAAFDSNIPDFFISIFLGKAGEDGGDLAGAEEIFVEVFCLDFLDELLFFVELDFPARFDEG